MVSKVLVSNSSEVVYIMSAMVDEVIISSVVHEKFMKGQIDFKTMAEIAFLEESAILDRNMGGYGEVLIPKHLQAYLPMVYHEGTIH